MKIPPVNNKALRYVTTLVDTSFKVYGAKLWNLLPAPLNEKTLINPFKLELKAFLNNIPDEPPTTGYVGRNNNYLTDWLMQSGGLH